MADGSVLRVPVPSHDPDHLDHLLEQLPTPQEGGLRVPRLGRDPGAPDVLLLDDLGSGLRHLLRPHAARHHH